MSRKHGVAMSAAPPAVAEEELMVEEEEEAMEGEWADDGAALCSYF